MVCWHRRYNLGDDHDFRDPGHLFADLFFACELSDKDVRNVLLAYIRTKYGAEEYRDFVQRYSVEGETKDERRRGFIEHIADDLIETDARDAMMEVIEANYEILPLFLYDHSGITMNTGGFSCPWDSGQVGYIYVSHADLLKEYSAKSIDDPCYFQGKLIANSIREQGRKMLESEVKEYDQYLTGDIWGYTIEDEDGNDLESLWGMYGLEYCQEEAESAAKHLAEKLAGGTYCI
jgi:hypothetical protein